MARRTALSVGGACVWLLTAGWALCCSPSRAAAEVRPRTGAATQEAPATAEMRRRAERAAEQGGALYSRGRHAEALRAFETALATWKKVHGGCDHPDVAASLNNVAVCLSILGRSSEGVAHAQTALAMNQRLFARRDHPNLARSLSITAFCLKAADRWPEALTKARAAVAMLQRLYKDQDHPDVARGLNLVALCLGSLRRSTEALPKHEAALAMHQRLYKGRDHPDVATSLDNLAGCLMKLSRAEEALPKFEAALAMARRLYGKQDHPDVGRGLNNLAFCLTTLGRTTEALPIYEAAIAMTQRLANDRDHRNVAVNLHGLADCLNDLGRSAEALPVIRAALAMHRRLHKRQDHPDVAACLGNLALCLMDLGRPAEALPLFEAAVAMHRRLHGDQDHPETAAGLNNLGYCLGALGRDSQALSMHERALAMRRRLHGDRDHPSVAVCLDNLSAALRALNRPAEALVKCEAALAMRRRLHKDQDHLEVAISLNNVGACLSSLKRPDEALGKYQAAVQMGERLASPHAFRFASNLGRLCLRGLDNPAQAAEVLEKAVAGMESARVQVGGHEMDRAGYFAHIRRCGAFEGMVQAQVRLKRPDKALVYAERGRALGLRDVLERGERLQGGDLLGPIAAAAKARGDSALLNEVSEARKRQREALREVSTRIARIHLVRGRTDLSEEQRRERIEKLSAELAEAREAHLSARRVVFNLAGTHAVHDMKPLTADEIRALLLEGQWLLTYTLSDEDGVLLVVPPKGREIRGFELKWPDGERVTEATLGKAVGRYVSGMIMEGKLARGAQRQAAGKHSPAAHAALGYSLFRALIPAELWPKLRSAEHLYIVPDGVLHRLPFETLIVQEPKGKARSARERGYWVDVGPPLVYGPSATVLVNRKKRRDQQLRRLAKGSSPKREAVLLGDPIFRRERGPQAPVPKQGAVVMNVKTGSAAERLGIRRGAVITRYGPHPVGSVEQLDEAFDRLSGQLRRRQLEAMPRLAFWQQGMLAQKELSPKEELGVRLSDLDAGLRQRLASGEPLDPSLQTAMVERSGYLSRYGLLPQLSGTRKEVRRIYRTLTGKEYRAQSPDATVTVLLGEDATRTRLFQAAAGTRYLHLATHGLVDVSHKAIHSSLALTQPKVVTPEDFGFLTLVDLFDNWWGRLGATELVVLSACDTQRGRMEAGEGVFGISWGFLYAGSPAVIASLWHVADESTAEMMGGLYARIRRHAQPQGSRVPRAKLRAFLDVRKRLRQTYPEPYFWAPFIYIGDPR